MPQFQGKIIFLEDYNMIVAKRLVTGVDIWLNTPTRPSRHRAHRARRPR